MQKVLWSIAFILMTLALVMVMIDETSEPVIEAELVRVERADVHQVIPIYGKLVYEDERNITAKVSGVVSQLCVEKGERVGANAALMRIETVYADEAKAALAAAPGIMKAEWNEGIERLKKYETIRSDAACTVRQAFVKEGAEITAGMPLLRVSSNKQKIICSATVTDAAKIETGMWAWLKNEGEYLCTAVVDSVGEREFEMQTGQEVQRIVLTPEKWIGKTENTMIDADIYISGSDNVLSLPLHAITGRETVWWVDGERCTEIPAQIVMHDEMRAWVRLPEGMMVAVGEFSEGQIVREVTP